MRRFIKPLILLFFAIDVVLVLFLLVSGHSFLMFEPKGIVAARERDLFLTVSLLGLFVVSAVVATMFITAFRFRATNTKVHRSEVVHHNLFQFIWWIFPTIVVIGLSILIWTSSHQLDPLKPLPLTTKPLTIQVVALEWKWLFIYPEQNIATVNFVEFPEKTPVTFQLTAEAPMNSFWIPQLGGQMYAMEGMVNKTHLIANTTGEFPGYDAEIDGKGYAGMHFTAKAVTSQDFTAWVEKTQAISHPLDLATYNSLAKPSEDTPPAFYAPVQSNLYNSIVSKYLAPSKTPNNDSMAGMGM